MILHMQIIVELLISNVTGLILIVKLEDQVHFTPKKNTFIILLTLSISRSQTQRLPVSVVHGHVLQIKKTNKLDYITQSLVGTDFA